MNLEDRHMPRVSTELESVEEVGHRDVVQAFNRVGYPLHESVQRLLLEEEGVFENRKGSGYTQLVYRLLNGHTSVDELFDTTVSEKIAEQVHADEYEHTPDTYVEINKLMEAASYLVKPDSMLLARLIVHTFKRYEPKPGDTVLPVSKQRAKSGACTTAETYYLEFLSDPGQYRWRGGETAAMSVITDNEGKPVLLEKEGGLGDDYSCIALQEIIWNGYKLPAGTLLSVDYSPEMATQERINMSREKRGSKEIPLSACTFRALRFTTLSVDPLDRQRAFGTHLEWQKRNGFPECETATIQQLAERSSSMLQGSVQTSL